MKKEVLEEWRNHAVSKELFRLIKEHRDANLEAISKVLINSRTIADVDLHQISQFKGQLFALDQILDIESFLEETIDKEKVILEDEDEV